MAKSQPAPADASTMTKFSAQRLDMIQSPLDYRVHRSLQGSF